jgi:hypothetical protein
LGQIGAILKREVDYRKLLAVHPCILKREVDYRKLLAVHPCKMTTNPEADNAALS